MKNAVLLPLLLCFVQSWIVLGQKVLPLEDKKFWFVEGKTRLQQALEKQLNVNEARNVIIFVGDGMGISTITASRIFSKQQQGHTGEEGYLTFDTFPHVGLIKTYNVDKQVPDSAATASAMFTGVKTNYYTLGVDATVTPGVCDATTLERASVSSLMSWAQDIGKDTGIVTTTRITHATPAATYANSPHRYWECDQSIPVEFRGCAKDIARQLVEDEPGKNFKVILGGGLHALGVENSTNETSCTRRDGRNLVDTWLQDKEARGARAKFVRTTSELMSVKPGKDDYVFGLFAHGHMDYDVQRNREPSGSPSLVNMTRKAIQMLQHGKNGFVLMVEGGRIDHAHHDNMARLSLLETVQFDAAVAAALEMTSRNDTLILVTADHSHTMTINGYPKRGNDILGLSDSDETVMAYETLTYANGPGYLYHRKAGMISEGEYLWRNVSLDESRQEFTYQHFAPIMTKMESHGGEDVAIYAIGPYSHLFTGVHEQSFIAHAVSCAGRFGPHSSMCTSSARKLQGGIFGALTLSFIMVLKTLF